MSANAQVVPPNKQYLLPIVRSLFRVDEHTSIEAHIRITPPDKQGRGARIQNGPRSGGFNKGAFAPIPKPGDAIYWYESNVNPRGWNARGGQTELDEEGHAPIREDFLKFFDSHQGALMVKVVTDLRPGYIACAGFLNKPLWYIDQDENPREYGITEGKYGYSFPFHNLFANKIGQQGPFFYVITIEGLTRDQATIQIYRIQVTRAQEHFHFAKKRVYESSDGKGSAQVWLHRYIDVFEDHVREGENRHLFGLALEEAIRLYQKQF